MRSRLCSGVSPLPPQPMMWRSPTEAERIRVLVESRRGRTVAASSRRSLVRLLPPRRAAGPLRHRAPAVHAACPARERAPHGHRARCRGRRKRGPERRAVAGDRVLAVPPGTGICHQVNLEYLARVVEARDGVAYPDTLVGTDSHTTMINGLGVLGWGVGGIEAEAGMLGQPLSMLVPQVVGFKLRGSLPDGATATDLVLTVTQMLRQTGVGGKFVEYFGPGVGSLPVADRATIGNMSDRK